MSKKTTNWANSEHYAKVYAHLELNKLDVENTHYYLQLLESNGLHVFVKDLKQWIEARNSKLNEVAFEL